MSRGSPPEPSAPEDPSSSIGWGTVALGLLLLSVLVAAGAFVWSGVNTATARIAGSTTSDGSLFAAGTIDLVLQPDTEMSAVGLLINAEGLYPGLVIERCLPLTYHGTVDAVPVRGHGSSTGGTGLEQYLKTEVEVGSGSSVECDDFEASTSAFSGSLGQLWQQHGSFPEGFELIPAANDGDSVTLRVSVEVASDDAAQGLTTEFWIILEARP